MGHVGRRIARFVLVAMGLVVLPVRGQDFVWHRSEGGMCRDMAIDPAGNLVAAGEKIVTYERATGSILSSQVPDYSDLVGSPISVAIDASGNVVAAAPGSFPLCMIKKIDRLTGAVLWMSSGGMFAPDTCSNIVFDATGNPHFAEVQFPYQFRMGVYTSGSTSIQRFDGATGGRVGYGAGFQFAMSYPQLAIDRARNVLAISGMVIRPGQDPSEAVLIVLDGVTGATKWWVFLEPSFYPVAFAFDAAGDLFVTGTRGASGARPDIVTKKYGGATGAALWSSAYRGDSAADCAYNEHASAVAVDGQADVVVTGASCDSIGGPNIRTIKYAGATGDMLWTAVHAGSLPPFDSSAAPESGRGVAFDAAGNVIVSGTSVDGAGGSNLRVIKYRGDTGSEIWTVAYNGTANGTDSGDKLVLGAEGGIFVGGSSTETGFPESGFVGKIQDVALALGATPSPVVIGAQSLYTTTPAIPVKIRNQGPLSVTIGSVTVQPPYSVTHDCATLAAGDSCVASLTFAPVAEGPLIGTLAVTSGANSLYVAILGRGERSLVSHYYRSILRRAPDAPGQAYWEGEAGRAQLLGLDLNEVWYAMAGAFYNSAEYLAFDRDGAGFVTDLYNTFFNRLPDAAGLAYWTGQLTNGLPREVVLVSFMFSSEFVNFTQAIYGSTPVREEIDTVTDFYRGYFSRLPDNAGFNNWAQQFRYAQCAGASVGQAVYMAVESISSAFSNSPEYDNRGRTHAQYVGDLYNAFLRRGGDLDGALYWIRQLDTGARSREGVRQQFVASPEFSARVAAIIAQGCLP